MRISACIKGAKKYGPLIALAVAIGIAEFPNIRNRKTDSAIVGW
jgi:hypothetical protein